MTTTPTPDWGVEDLDLDSYLARVDHPKVAPTLAALRTLHSAHVRAIPFENITVLLDGTPEITVKAVADKLVGQRRGGYCFEHATLFAAAAEQLGYAIRRRIARVSPHRGGPRTHMMLVATIDGADHLVDVGWGAQMWQPMPLVDGAEVDQAGWPRKLTPTEIGWTLWTHGDDGEWMPDHEFEDLPMQPADFEVGNHYAATGAKSPFPGKLIVKQLEPGISRRLIGDELTVVHADGRTSTTPFGLDQLDEILPGFGIELDADQLAALRAKLG
ncbi:Arylamine N-acetyltransferase [Alloactinosynnema sp. L-07]|uniref:arylamine N-acetyltransferase family protein n=1 Tax=Alloactinosynnema sp. L-07 TaxID=1653480 RepID=UPI00065EF559|nr:arylamine N-acetyltransferase [Alloactinosynnema sp. L-07]CRK57161.1 Arylamine N-acetyltransferase [Alloactinosynnema sp. L-07]